MGRVLRTFRVDLEDWEAFKAWAERNGRVPSDMLRGYVARFSPSRAVISGFMSPEELAEEPRKHRRWPEEPVVGPQEAPRRRDDPDFRAAEAFVAPQAAPERPVRSYTVEDQLARSGGLGGKGRKSPS